MAERIPERPPTEPVETKGWVNQYGHFMDYRPASAMSDEFLRMSGVVPATRYRWPASTVVQRIDESQDSQHITSKDADV